MAKKSSSSKKHSNAKEKPAVEQTTAAPKPSKMGKEIDEIFGGKKRKTPEPEKTEKKLDKDTRQSSEEILTKETEKKKKKKRKGEKPGGFGDLPTRPRKRTADGLVIYTEDELGVNKANAGGTPLCPFDCDCCF